MDSPETLAEDGRVVVVGFNGIPNSPCGLASAVIRDSSGTYSLKSCAEREGLLHSEEEAEELADRGLLALFEEAAAVPDCDDLVVQYASTAFLAATNQRIEGWMAVRKFPSVLARPKSRVAARENLSECSDRLANALLQQGRALVQRHPRLSSESDEQIGEFAILSAESPTQLLRAGVRFGLILSATDPERVRVIFEALIERKVPAISWRTYLTVVRALRDAIEVHKSSSQGETNVAAEVSEIASLVYADCRSQGDPEEIASHYGRPSERGVLAAKEVSERHRNQNAFKMSASPSGGSSSFEVALQDARQILSQPETWSHRVVLAGELSSVVFNGPRLAEAARAMRRRSA